MILYKLFWPSTQGKLDVHLGKETFSVQISRATNSIAEPSLETQPIMEVTEILPFDSPESLLEKDAEKFIKEEDEPTEPIDISVFETPHRPPIELKPFPQASVTPSYMVIPSP